MVKMIFKIWTVLCLGAVLSFSAMAQTFGLPKLKKGETYRAVRVKMLRAGWKPFHAPDADECAAGDKRCEGRPEMERCSGTGVGACRFLWKKGGKTVALLTAGENVAIYQGFRAVR